MLYLLHANGEIEELASAVTAKIDDESRCLLCLDRDGVEVARYPFLEITMYSTSPLPAPQASA